MSKRVEAELECTGCGTDFEATLYRSLWIEYAENRNLVFEDRVNVVECPSCHGRTRIPFSLLCTNVDRNIAVWYEPFPDEAVDKDLKGYEVVFGPDSFLAMAPRIGDWDEFKRTIRRFEEGELMGNPVHFGRGKRVKQERLGMLERMVQVMKEW